MENNVRWADRTYIDVPQAKTDEVFRNQIKEAGAQWDNTRKSWYYGPNAKNKELLDTFDKIDPQTLTKVVNKFIKIPADKYTPELKEHLSKDGASWVGEQGLWRVKEINGNLPDYLSAFEVIPYDQLKKQVFIKVSKEQSQTPEFQALKREKKLGFSAAHVSWFAMVDPNTPEEQNLFGYPVHKPENLQKTYHYLNIPQAKTDENLRNELKQAGAQWSPTYQSWLIASDKHKPFPEEYKKYELPKQEVVKYELLQFDIPEANPQHSNAAQVQNTIKSIGATWNKESKTYDFWKHPNKPLPDFLQNYKPIDLKQAKEEQQKQQQKQQQNHNHR